MLDKYKLLKDKGITISFIPGVTDMIRPGRVIIVFLASMCALSSGCATQRGGSALQRYEELKTISYGSVNRSNMSDIDLDLTENSTLSDYLAYAALHNPELEAAFYRWKASIEKIPQVRSLPDPRLTYAYYIENVETRVGPQRHSINVSQTFPWFGTRGLRGDIASDEANALWEKFEAVKRRVFFNVKRSYYEYYYLSRAIAITDENINLLTGIETVVQNRYASGRASYSDVIRLQVETGKLEERLFSVKDLKNPVTAELNTALNRAAAEPLPAPSSLPDIQELPSEEKLTQLLSENNPELKELEFQAEKDIKAIDLAKKKLYPDITMGLNYIETGSTSMPGISDSGRDAVLGMISINLPLWRERYHAAVRESEIRYKSKVKDKNARENTLAAVLKRALYNYRDSERKIELYTKTLIPKAREALTVSLLEYETGKTGFLDIIDAQRTLLELELSYERELSGRARHYAEIIFLAGDEAGESEN